MAQLTMLRRIETAIPSGRGARDMFQALRPEDDPQAWRSTLNNDGTPYQIAMSDTGDGASVRLIVDPFRLGRDECDRAGRNSHAFAQIADRCSAKAAERCRKFMTALAPSFAQGCDRRSGDVWLAALPQARGVGIYVSARSRDPQDGCARIIAAAGLHHHHAAIAAIHAHGTVEAYSIQGSRIDDLAVNIYWKLPPGSIPVPAAIGFAPPILSSGSPPSALSRAPVAALTLCSTFSVTGPGTGSKLDMCNHCLNLDLDECMSTLHRLCEISSGFERDVACVVANGSAQIAFLGVRVGPINNRAYVYLKPAREGRDTATDQVSHGTGR